jgi:alpha-N-acetylglucosaminidase
MINYLYNIIIDDVTNLCYGNCLDYFSDHSTILDVGIGNGAMLEQHHATIRLKNLKITGIDINRQYLSHCRKLIRRYRLEDAIDTHFAPVETYLPPGNHYFDFIFFSMSFMLFQDQQLVLDRIKPWLKPNGGVVFFQTMFKDRSILLEIVKPRLKYVTTVDFGRVTYEKEFFELLSEKDMTITEDRVLKREWFRGEYRLIVSEPQNGNGRHRALAS